MKLEEFKQIIKDEDIIDVLERCELVDKDEINNRTMLCPFHDEKTPSLHFYEDSFYCFGCQEGGDVFAFVEKIEDLSFIQACLFIADHYNIELDVELEKHRNPFLKTDKSMEKKLEDEWKQYKENMKNAPDAAKARAKEMFPLETGYDKDLNYVVLRFTSKTNKTLAFTKRRVDDNDTPKWLHSKKNNSLIENCYGIFNLGGAAKEIRLQKSVILVEGPKDCIPFIMENHKNVIATSGTSNSSERLFEILPDLDSAYFAYDGDSAGRKGTLNLIETFSTRIPLDKLYVYGFPDGVDPYDFYKQNNGLPEPSSAIGTLTKDELKDIYSCVDAYNRSIIERELISRGMELKEVQAFLSSKQKQRVRKDELERLISEGDEKALQKMKLKFGVS